MYTMGCAAILVYVHVIVFKKHAEFIFIFFLSCHRVIRGSGSMRFGIFQGGEDSTCSRVDCSTV